MPSVSLKAHFDGKRIVLDEPFDIAPNSPLLVTVLADAERADFAKLAAQSLTRAFGSDEPDYTIADVKKS
jgi:hypothetical protein